MTSETKVRQATQSDTEVVADILGEAARWLEQTGMPLWKEDELTPAHIGEDVSSGLYFLAECSGASVGTVKFQLEDPIFWPEMTGQDAAYVHRLAVRRRYAGFGLSTILLHWAVERTRALGRQYLRLDCEASRTRLRAIYESFGFNYHSARQVGSHLVARYEYDLHAQHLVSR
jgi:GNAT superfamily N-acetyltransferase